MSDQVHLDGTKSGREGEKNVSMLLVGRRDRDTEETAGYKEGAGLHM